MPIDASDLADLADLADAIAMAHFSTSGVDTTAKADGSPVTVADPLVEARLLAEIRDRFPGDGFLGEESGEHPGHNGRRWIVDGIDGTNFYAVGATTWGTLIALEIDGDVIAGMATAPAMGRRWWAVRDQGAWTVDRVSRPEERPVRSGWSEPRAVRVAAPRPVQAEHLAVLPWAAFQTAAQVDALEALAGGSPPDRSWNHHLMVAEGAVDAALWFMGEPWDLAASVVIVEEAGGRFSDPWGGRRLDGGASVFSNGHEHEAMCAAVCQGMAPGPVGY